ncbi:MAG: hypothetical protein R2720_10915 [Candidatus Nanopelagicales bacterium]
MAGALTAGVAALLGVSSLVGGWSPLPGPRTAAEVASDYAAGPRQSASDADYYLVDASGNWSAPRCIGNGRSGARVQPVFVYRKGYPNRFPRFRTVLQRSTALTTGIFERSSGALRTVRWVHDSACKPVIWQVSVPVSVSHNLVNLRRYLTDRYPRFRRSNRVYSLWVDSTTSPSWSGLGGDRWSATWSSSWGFVWVDAHELVHALGAVSASAPHSTGKGHCYDAYDVMCYSDGGVRWRKATMCPSPSSVYRLDCGDDDYFAVRPKKGSWLARHPGANVANSRFVARVKARPLPVEPAAPTNVLRDGYAVIWDSVPGVRYDVGTMPGRGSIRWIATDVTSGGMVLNDVDWDTKVFVRAVSDAGYSAPVRAAFR